MTLRARCRRARPPGTLGPFPQPTWRSAMAERDEVLREVRQLEYVWIALRDGARLAARVWLPDDADADPVPAILEAVPYRLSDGMATRDVLIHPYWAARGYACVRVDLRGSGESDGVLEDEYARPGAGGPPRGHRLDRRPAVVQRRRRHDGHLVGRLQQPPAGRPPAAGAQGDHHAHEHRRPLRRRRALQGRLPDGHGPPALELDHAALAVPAAARGRGRRALARALATLVSRTTSPGSTRGSRTSAATTTGSTAPVCEDYAAIEVPVYAIGGWTDGYTNSVPRLLEGLPGPRKGPDRPVGARLPALRGAGAGHRLPARVAALVGPLAEG